MNYFGMFAGALALTVGGWTQAAKPATVKSLQGTWILTSVNGQAPQGAPEVLLTFEGDKYHQTIAGEVTERGTFKLDPAKKPVAIDLAITQGDDAGKTQLGIVDVADDEIRFSLDMPGAGRRPGDFTVKEGAIVFAGKKRKP
jgi:uncharacterized protein (TIGR03067 family)